MYCWWIYSVSEWVIECDWFFSADQLGCKEGLKEFGVGFVKCKGSVKFGWIEDEM